MERSAHVVGSPACVGGVLRDEAGKRIVHSARDPRYDHETDNRESMLCDWLERQRREPHRQRNNNAENLPDNDEGGVCAGALGASLLSPVH
jgi:hypothetical protein